MSTDQNPTTDEQPPTAGEPEQPARQGPRWSTRKTIAAVAIAVGIAGAGGAAIHAASGPVDAPDRGRAAGDGSRASIDADTVLGNGDATMSDIAEGDDVTVIASTVDGATVAESIREDGAMRGPHGQPPDAVQPRGNDE